MNPSISSELGNHEYILTSQGGAAFIQRSGKDRRILRTKVNPGQKKHRGTLGSVYPARSGKRKYYVNYCWM